jgi:flagellar motor protein MotB
VAAKGGGAWKVAYADFVTAMMAFFLVMWITAQDQKIKKAVAYYFTDPLGASKKPGKTGSVSENPNSGAVPDSEKVTAGTGRYAFSAPDEPSRATKKVNDWLHADKKAIDHWTEQAKRFRDAAARNPEKGRSVEEVAAHRLANQMRTEISRDAPTQASGVYQDLLYDAINQVNWLELAEELVRK